MTTLGQAFFGLLSGWVYYPGEFYVKLKVLILTGLIKRLGLLSEGSLTDVYCTYKVTELEFV